VLVEGLPERRRFFFGGGDHDESEATSGSQLHELTKLTTLIDVGRTLARDVRRGPPQINADEFQDTVNIAAMGCCGQRGGQPRTELSNFAPRQSGPWRSTVRRIDQHGVFDGK